jgi:protocatechuate 3,4-dioxygenase beta subunit
MTDHRTRPGRRSLLRWIAGAPLASGLLLPALASEKLIATPSIMLGPFYPVRKPQDRDADLTLIRGHREHAAGAVVELSGRVMTLDGKPVPHAVLEIWQANHNGRYAHPADTSKAPLDPHFQGYAFVRADREGRYSVRTIKPGAYPAMEGWVRPPHIHFDVQGKDYRTVLQMFFPGEGLNEKDRLYLEVPEAERTATVARQVGAGDGVTRLEWDIVLLAG